MKMKKIKYRYKCFKQNISNMILFETEQFEIRIWILFEDKRKINVYR